MSLKKKTEWEGGGGIFTVCTPLLSAGVAGKEGGDFFHGGCNFSTKNKLKSEMFNDKKKFINKNALLCHN